MAQKSKFRSNDRREEAEVEEFIPFACHYDPSTLLTKNGEILQTIKIVGFSFESVNKGDATVSLRRALRRAITENIKTSNFAVWIHTVRRKKNLSTGGKYPEGGFADYLNKSWCEKHDWEHKYVNELYVTIIREGQNFNFSAHSFFRGMAFGAEVKYREKYLEDSFKDLNATAERVLTALHDYGARRLTMYEKAGITYSEPLQFFGKVLNLKETPMPVPLMDLSEYLPTHKTLFGFTTIEVAGETGKHYGAILSIKEYHEVTSTAIDEFLQLDQEFIITETFDFINNSLVQKKFEHQQYILSLSQDKVYAQVSGLNNILSSNKNRPTDYGEHQITIMLVEDDLRLLEEETIRIMKAFNDLGILAIREDVMLEDCYWSQLPGNFEFLRRLSSINTAHVGGFASLYNFPAGRLEGNHWGSALTVFYTKANTPYFFNFHDEDNGHTTIIGPYGAGKTVLLNFLVSESCKYNPKIFFFDQHRGSELFIRALGGKYKRILKDNRSTQLRFNPLLLKDSPDNRVFLKLWLYYLMMDENYQLPEEVRNRLDEVIEYNFRIQESERRLSVLAQRFWPVNEDEVAKKLLELERKESSKNEKKEVQNVLEVTSSEKKQENQEKEEERKAVLLPKPEERLATWYGKGKYAHLFDNAKDEIDFSSSINGFDITEMVQEKYPIIPVFAYMSHRISQSLDGSPAIVVLDEAWRIVDNKIFAPRLEGWLDDLRSKNAIAIFATESVEDATSSSITRPLVNKIATQIFLPNDDATVVYKDIFGLSEKEYNMLNSMSGQERHFLLKHHGDAVVARLNLTGMNDIIAILSGNRENIAVLESIILEIGDDPKRWLPVFRQRFKK